MSVKKVEVVEKSKRGSLPFPWCPVNRESSWKKTQKPRQKKKHQKNKYGTETITCLSTKIWKILLTQLYGFIWLGIATSDQCLLQTIFSYIVLFCFISFYFIFVVIVFVVVVARLLLLLLLLLFLIGIKKTVMFCRAM